MPKIIYQDSDGIDKAFELAMEVVTIGRATECEINTQDAMVSRRHARLSWDGAYCWIEDLGSSNGVYVGREKVQRAPFGPGDIVTCGSMVLRMVLDTQPHMQAVPAVASVPAMGPTTNPDMPAVPAPSLPDPYVQPAYSAPVEPAYVAPAYVAPVQPLPVAPVEPADVAPPPIPGDAFEATTGNYGAPTADDLAYEKQLRTQAEDAARAEFQRAQAAESQLQALQAELGGRGAPAGDDAEKKELRQKVLELKNEVHRMREDETERSARGVVEAERDRLRQRFDDLQAETESNRERFQQRIADLQTELDRAKQAPVVDAEKTALKASVEELKGEMKRLRVDAARVEDLERAKRSLEEERSQLAARSESLRNDLERALAAPPPANDGAEKQALQDQVKELRGELRALEDEGRDLRDERERLSGRVASLEKEIQDKIINAPPPPEDPAIKRLEHENQRLREELSGVVSTVRSAEEERDRVRYLTQDLEDELKGARAALAEQGPVAAERDRLRAQVAELDAAVKKAAQPVEDPEKVQLQKLTDDLMADLDHARKESARLDGELKKSQAAVEAARAAQAGGDAEVKRQLTEAQGRLGGAEDAAAKAHDEIEKLRAEVERAKGEAQRTRDELAGVHDSTAQVHDDLQRARDEADKLRGEAQRAREEAQQAEDMRAQALERARRLESELANAAPAAAPADDGAKAALEKRVHELETSLHHTTEERDDARAEAERASTRLADARAEAEHATNDLQRARSEAAEAIKKKAAASGGGGGGGGIPAAAVESTSALGDVLAELRASLRAASDEATMFTTPADSVQVVADALSQATGQLENAREHLRALQKHVGAD